jgi:hypothetical protein
MMEAVSGTSRDRLLTLARGEEEHPIPVLSDEYHSVFTMMDGVLSEFS